MNLLVTFNIAGTIGFIAASYFAFKNYAFTNRLSEYWRLFGIATVIASVWLLLASIEDVGISLGAAEPFEELPFIIAMTLFVAAAITYPSTKDLASPKK